MRLLREVTTAPVGTNQHTEGRDIVTTLPQTSERGNSKAYTLDRLHREAPELYEAVKAGDKTANEAAIEAGFRVKTITVPLDVRKAAATLRRHFSAEEVEALAEALR